MKAKHFAAPSIAALVGISATALGQSAGTESVLDEVVVTAQKRSESLQEVPVAISAFTSETRDLLGISSIQDLTNFTPGLSYSTSLDRASLRGIGRQTNNLATDPGIATYTDGFYNVSTRSAARSPLLIDRIEILRGPQGTLYGRNSIGGTINVISKRPTDEQSGEIRMGYDNWSRSTLEGTFSGPVNDWLKYRFAGTYARQTEGYFKNWTGGPDEGGIEDDQYFELQLDFQITDNLSLWLKGSMAEYDNSRRATAFTGDYDYARNPPSYLVVAGAYGLVLQGANPIQGGGQQSSLNPTLYDIRAFAGDTPTSNKLDDNGTILAELNWDIGPVNVKYMGGFSSYFYKLVTDYDQTGVRQFTIPLLPAATVPNPTTGVIPCPAPCGPVTYFPAAVSNYVEDKQYYSHEIDVSSDGEGPLNWIGGLYYYQEAYQQPVYFPSANSKLATPVGGPPNPDTYLYYIDTHLDTRSSAVFGQLDWDITEAFKATVGLRYTNDVKSGKELTRQVCYGLTPALGCPDLALFGTNAPASDVTAFLISRTAPPGTTGVPTLNPATGIWERGLHAEWSATTGTAGIAWTPVDDTMMFLKYSRGYKAGGLNTGTIVSAPLTNEEVVDAFEFGAKTQFFGRLQINGSLFYYEYDAMQIPLSVNPIAGPPVTQYFNMDVLSRGVEIETIWQATDHLQVLFNYALLNPFVKKGATSCCFTDNNDPSAQQPEATPSGPASGVNQGQDLTHARVPQSPKHKAALNLNYTFDLANSSLNVSVSDTWKDRTYFSIFNRWYNEAPSYHQLDMRMTWKLVEEKVDLVAFGRNVLDDLGYDGTTGSRQTQLPATAANLPTIPSTIAQNISLTPPRTYGLELRYKF